MTGPPLPPPPQPPPRPPLPEGVPFADALPREDHAGVLRRTAALLIDVAVVSVASAGFAPAGVRYVPPEGIARQVMVIALAVVLGWGYSAGMQSGRQQATLGKVALAIAVTDLDGRRVSFDRATRRYLGGLLSVATLGVGFLMAARTRRAQALHDLLAGTLVVRRDALAGDRRPAGL